MEKIERNMKQFTATKTVKAIPMTRTDAEKFLGRSITPADPKRQNFATALRLSTRSL